MDSGATRSFIAESIIDRLKCVVYPLEPNFIIEVANQERVNANRMCPNCDMVIEGRHFSADLIPFKLGEFDVTLGMDLLSNHDAQVECKSKKVKLRTKDGDEVIFRGKKPEKKFQTAIQTKILSRQGCEAYLAHVKDLEAESLRIEDIPVVKDFPDLCPDELPRLPPVREIEFTTDLTPGAEPVSKAPYQMALVEMKKLATQLHELLEKGVIRPSVSQWGAPMLFVKKKDVNAVVFDMEYVRWLEEQQRLMFEQRAAIQEHLGDNELQIYVENFLSYFNEIMNLKCIIAKTDVFHLISGTWKTLAERCFMWIAGFRPYDIIKMMGIYGLTQSTMEADEALSQGLDALNQSISDVMDSNLLTCPANMSNYRGQIGLTMGKLSTLEGFVRQSNNNNIIGTSFGARRSFALTRSNQKMIVEELDLGTAGPTQVKELTAEVAADPSTHGDRELPKQPELKPKCLFPPPEAPPEDQFLGLKDSLQKDRKRKTISDQRFRVQTSKGKKVLSSDIRLHSEKKERLKAQNQENPEDPLDSDEELEFLEHEARRLQAKLERKREIHRLRRELQQTTVQNEEQDDEFYDDDDAEYEYEPSAESTYSQPRERRQRTVSSADVSRQT
ncbi:hypothetical protein AgCh_000956 [Apium graveolens]